MSVVGVTKTEPLRELVWEPRKELDHLRMQLVFILRLVHTDLLATDVRSNFFRPGNRLENDVNTDSQSSPSNGFLQLTVLSTS